MTKQLTDDQMYRRVRLNTIAIMGSSRYSDC
jgi:hypothetical protein